jgi:hypothetical protein
LFGKIGLPQNVQQFFLDFLLKVKLIGSCYIEKCLKLYILSVFSQKIEIFEKKRFFHFLQKKVKIVFLVNFDLKFGKNIKNLVSRVRPNLGRICIQIFHPNKMIYSPFESLCRVDTISIGFKKF